jgi:hypothetical protein
MDGASTGAKPADWMNAFSSSVESRFSKFAVGRFSTPELKARLPI